MHFFSVISAGVYSVLWQKQKICFHLLTYFPENVQETFYKPTHLGYEEFISKRLKKCWPNRYK